MKRLLLRSSGIFLCLGLMACGGGKEAPASAATKAANSTEAPVEAAPAEKVAVGDTVMATDTTKVEAQAVPEQVAEPASAGKQEPETPATPKANTHGAPQQSKIDSVKAAKLKGKKKK